MSPACLLAKTSPGCDQKAKRREASADKATSPLPSRPTEACDAHTLSGSKERFGKAHDSMHGMMNMEKLTAKLTAKVNLDI